MTPVFEPAYRAAAAAYRKYLALAPNASDAGSVRSKLEKLEQP